MDANKRILAVVIGTMIWSAAASVLAQSPGGSDDAIEEIIVTSRKTAEDVQDVSLAIAAFTGEQLDRSALTTTEELQLRAPGMVMSTNTALGLIFIRGVGTELLYAGLDRGVAVHLDGVYQPRANGVIQQFVDVERVEVVKGPQGTLYGRNSLAGAINVISKQPSEEVTGRADVTVGNYNHRMFRGTVSGPLVEDKLLGRVSVISSSIDGNTENVLLGIKGNGGDEWSIRGALKFIPTSNLDIVLNASYAEKDFTPTIKSLNPETNPMIQVRGAMRIDDPRVVMHDTPSNSLQENWGVSAKVNWDLNAFSLSSITAYTETEWQDSEDIDATELSVLNGGFPIPFTLSADLYSQEFILTSQTDGPLQWTALLNFIREEGFNNWPVAVLISDTFSAVGGDVTTNAYGIAGEVTYSVTDNLRLIGGVRLNDETKEVDLSQIVNGALVGTATGKKSWTEWTPKFGVEYDFAEDIMFYTSATKGFKSGGFNTSTLTDISIDPEFLWSYELGLKTMLADDRVRANFSAFFYDYTDLQVFKYVTDPIRGFVGNIENASDATISGVEVDLLATPISGLQLEANLAYLSGRYDEFFSGDPDRPEEGLVNRKGNPLPRSPDFTASLAAQYTWSLYDVGELTLRGEFYHRDRIYFTPFKDDRVSEEPIDLWNVHLFFKSDDGRWYASVTGKNLGNVDYTTFRATSQGLYGQIGFYAAPRTYGLQIGYNF